MAFSLIEYIKHLNEFVKNHPESAMLQVYTASDDEGNSYNPVHFTPSILHIDGNGETYSSEDIDTDTDLKLTQIVCVN